MNRTGQRIEIKYSDSHSQVFGSRSEFAKHLSISVPRTKALLRDRRILNESEYEEILAASYKPALVGVPPGTRRKK